MIEITANTRQATVTNKELLTTGSAGIQVQFTLSEDFAGLSKLAVFRQGEDGKKVDVALDSHLTCVVPAEVLTEEGEVLFIGIYGANGQGTVIIPTVWATAGVVKPGTDPNTPVDAEPTPEIWAQILGIASDAEQAAGDALTMATRAANAAEEAIDSCSEDRAAAEFARDQAQAASNSASSASGSAWTQALKAEGYAVGRQDGQEVGSDSPYYRSNSAFFAGVAYTNMLATDTYKEQTEGMAYGTVDGYPVTSSSPYYHNNAKYYSEQADGTALKSEGYATGKQNGSDVGSGSPYYHNNAKFYSEVAGQTAGEAGWVYFYIDDNGILHYVRTENADLAFYIDANGVLHVTNAA